MLTTRFYSIKLNITRHGKIARYNHYILQVNKSRRRVRVRTQREQWCFFLCIEPMWNLMKQQYLLYYLSLIPKNYYPFSAKRIFKICILFILRKCYQVIKQSNYKSTTHCLTLQKVASIAVSFMNYSRIKLGDLELLPSDSLTWH